MSKYTLHLGDCLEYMRTLPDGAFDAVVTDPPYGIGGIWQGGFGHGWGLARTMQKKRNNWDASIVPGMEKVYVSYPSIVWGGNYYDLPPVRGWLVWDKMQKHSTGEAELAWSNIDQPVRVYRLSRVEAYGRMDKQHPAQKPIEIIRWCVEMISNPGDTIFDPFMGSGTTGVACMQLGRNFVGCEIDPEYYAIAEKRISEAAKQPLLFLADAPKETPIQKGLLDA